MTYHMKLTQTKRVRDIWEVATKEWKHTRLAGRGKAPVPIGLSTLYKLFNCPFFTGEFEWDGETRQGLHEPMVTREEFDRAQAILGRKGRPRPQKHESPYSGLVHCAECGSMIVMDPKRKFLRGENREKEYRYYRCSKRRKGTRCTQRGCTLEEELERQLTEIGEPALDALCKALTSDDPEVRNRARRIVAPLENRLYGAELSLIGHSNVVYCVCVSADGKRVLTSGDDEMFEHASRLRLWDAETGKQLRVFRGTHGAHPQRGVLAGWKVRAVGQ